MNIIDIIALILNYCCRMDNVAHLFVIKGNDIFWEDMELPFWFENDSLMMVVANKSNYDKVTLGHIENINDFMLALNKAQLDVLYKEAYDIITYDPDGDSEMVVYSTDLDSIEI